MGYRCPRSLLQAYTWLVHTHHASFAWLSIADALVNLFNRLAEPKKQALNAINKTLLKKNEGAALKLPRSPRGRGAG